MMNIAFGFLAAAVVIMVTTDDKVGQWFGCILWIIAVVLNVLNAFGVI